MSVTELYIVFGMFQGALYLILFYFLYKYLNKKANDFVDKKIEKKDEEIMKRVHGIINYRFEVHENIKHKKS